MASRGRSRLRTQTHQQILSKKISENFSTPSGCPTWVDRVFLEMITKILSAIQAATRCFRPQTQFPSRFARQSEFLF
jgi:hypothetical protein